MNKVLNYTLCLALIITSYALVMFYLGQIDWTHCKQLLSVSGVLAVFFYLPFKTATSWSTLTEEESI